MRANQLRLTFSAFAGALLTLLRQVGLQGTPLARARADTIRARLLKVGARITVTVRKVWIAFPSGYPLQELFAHVLAALRAPPVSAIRARNPHCRAPSHPIPATPGGRARRQRLRNPRYRPQTA